MVRPVNQTALIGIIWCIFGQCQVLQSSAKRVQPQLKDLPPAILQKHIENARHLPVCIILRRRGEGSVLEKNAVLLWQRASNTDAMYASWQLGSYSASQCSSSGFAPVENTPSIRCYISPKSYFDNDVKTKKMSLHNWLEKVAAAHEDRLPEGSVKTLAHTTSRHTLTVVGFTNLQNHIQLQEMLAQLRDDLRSLDNMSAVMFIHPHNSEIRELYALCGVKSYPAVAFLERTNVDAPVKVVHTLTSVHVTRHNIDVFLTARKIPAIHLTKDNFESKVMYKSRYHVPTLVCFYASWAPEVMSYLKAFHRAMDDLSELDVAVRFALFEVTTESQHVVWKYVQPGKANTFPCTILFFTRLEEGKVTDLNQSLLRSSLPTPLAVVDFLLSTGISLHAPSGENIMSHILGVAPQNKVSLLSEGPNGWHCSSAAHNATDDWSRPAILRRKRKILYKEKKPRMPSWHEQFSSERVDAQLGRVGKVPVITDDRWQDIVEKSHAPKHPFYPGGQWRGEVTKVTLVIFIIADCASCRRHLNMYDNLYNAISFVEGGSVYLMNCTSDPGMCAYHNISGFPTLMAFRGVGWLHGSHCVTLDMFSRQRYVALSYHGALLLDHVVDWFAQVAGSAVANMRFEEPDLHDMRANVMLVGDVIPKRSVYLHRARLQYRVLYPFSCFRLACERLYGQATCTVRYSPDIPVSEFTNDDTDMVVTKVMLYRSDGMSARVTELGERVLEILKQESGSSIHTFHQPHHYPLSATFRCEHNAAVCTDYIVAFTLDHSRLTVSQLTLATFHATNSVLTSQALPILIAFAYSDDLTSGAKFFKMLTSVGRSLYNDMAVVTVNVDDFLHWANRFVPEGYAKKVLDGEDATLYHYPRFCIVNWRDHHHAAFYPPPGQYPPQRYLWEEIVKFANTFLQDPTALLIPTEHF